MLFSRINEELIVFATFQKAPPKQQYQEYGGNDAPGDQQVKDGPRCER
jgi:hypothetical protein